MIVQCSQQPEMTTLPKQELEAPLYNHPCGDLLDSNITLELQFYFYCKYILIIDSYIVFTIKSKY